MEFLLFRDNGLAPLFSRLLLALLFVDVSPCIPFKFLVVQVFLLLSISPRGEANMPA